MEEEIWIDIKGWEDFYQISNFGRIKSKQRRNYREKITIGSLNEENYYYCTLQDRKRKQRLFVHRIVAFHFIENPFNLPIINHKDGNPMNNRVENLEWCDYSYNQIHAMKMGLFTPHTQKINYEIANKIRKEYFGGNISQRQLGLKYDLARTNINRIIKDKVWK